MVHCFLGDDFFFDEDDEALGSGVFLKGSPADHRGDVIRLKCIYNF
jgi:hypothetical protein